MMTSKELALMSVDELWKLHEDVIEVLSERIIAEKAQLESRLAQLEAGKKKVQLGFTPSSKGSLLKNQKRRYPPVMPRYQNPKVPAETWSGRGRQPRWIISALKSGHRLEDFSITRE